METKITKAQVRVMLSHNYNHFETVLEVSNDDGISISEIDNARKNANRLCNKAIEQYTKFKEKASKTLSKKTQFDAMKNKVASIKLNNPEHWTIEQKAIVKAFEDYNWDFINYNFDDTDDSY